MSFFGSLSYTLGNWTVSSLTTDTDNAGKALTIPDLTYSSDYAVKEDQPTEGKVVNTTSTTLAPAETLRFGNKAIENVYAGTGIGSSQQMPMKNGVRCLAEATCQLKAVNSVSGEEYLVPVKTWLCFSIPTASFISQTALEYAVGRCLGSLFATNLVTGSRLAELARGSLIPD